MKPFTKEDLRELMDVTATPCVSFYLPTDSVSTASQQNRIRLKNLMRQAEDQLKEQGMRSADLHKLLNPAEVLLSESLFWSHQQEGLAIFINPSLFRYFRLPITFPEIAQTGSRFHLKPLLPLLSQDDQFYLLTVSQNQIRFYQCTQESIHPLNLDGIPESLDEAMGYDQPEKQLQFNTRTPQASGDTRSAAFHGQGIGMENVKKDLLHFFHKVDAGIQQKMRDVNAPLVLAGVDYLFPIYREANTYPHLIDHGITGSPDELTPRELHQMALPVVEPMRKEAQTKAAELYAQLDGTGRTSRETEIIVPAAHHGRIEILFVSKGSQQFGLYHSDDSQVIIHESPSTENEDLLNIAALQTFLNGGVVYVLPREEMPVDADLAAIFRY